MQAFWGLGHVFEGKQYFTKGSVDDSFVPKDRQPKPIPKPAAKPAPKPVPNMAMLLSQEEEGYMGQNKKSGRKWQYKQNTTISKDPCSHLQSAKGGGLP